MVPQGDAPPHRPRRLDRARPTRPPTRGGAVDEGEPADARDPRRRARCRAVAWFRRRVVGPSRVRSAHDRHHPPSGAHGCVGRVRRSRPRSAHPEHRSGDRARRHPDRPSRAADPRAVCDGAPGPRRAGARHRVVERVVLRRLAATDPQGAGRERAVGNRVDACAPRCPAAGLDPTGVRPRGPLHGHRPRARALASGDGRSTSDPRIAGAVVSTSSGTTWRSSSRCRASAITRRSPTRPTTQVAGRVSRPRASPWSRCGTLRSGTPSMTSSPTSGTASVAPRRPGRFLQLDRPP